MKKYNALEKTGMVLIIIGSIITLLSFLNMISYKSEGLFLSSVGLILIGVGNWKKGKKQSKNT